MTVDLVIKNGKLVSPRGIVEGGIAINDGIIVSIAKLPNLPRADKVIDVKGNVILPGILDGHSHTDMPPETPFTGTKAAAYGGITTILDMPGGPAGNAYTPSKFEEKRKLFEKKSFIDFALHGGCPSGYTEGNLEKIWKLGATGIKYFMTRVGDGDILQSFKELFKVNGLALIHAENGDMIKHNIEKLRAQNRKDPKAHLESRPPITEIEAGERIISFLKETNIRGLIAHTSLPETVWNVKKNFNKTDIYIETCPQYLFLTTEDVIEKGPWATFAPPARNKERVVEMWNLLNKGWVDTIATDHVPESKEVKELGVDDIFDAPNGIPGIETMLPVMLTAVNEGKTTLQQLVALMSENPAKIYGLFPRKGSFNLGSDGDLVVIDMKKTKQIKNEEIVSACGWSPFEGFKIKGVPVLSMNRGNIILEDGEVVGKPGGAVFIPRMN